MRSFLEKRGRSLRSNNQALPAQPVGLREVSVVSSHSPAFLGHSEELMADTQGAAQSGWDALGAAMAKTEPEVGVSVGPKMSTLQPLQARFPWLRCPIQTVSLPGRPRDRLCSLLLHSQSPLPSQSASDATSAHSICRGLLRAGRSAGPSPVSWLLKCPL